MSRRWSARVAWGSCALILVLILCAAALALPNRYDLGLFSFLAAEPSAALVGALVASRRPRNPVGWFILGHAFCFSLGEFARQYAIYGTLTEPGSLPFAWAVIWPTYWVWYPGLLLMVAFLPLYFPDGRLVSPRWRWVVRATVLVAVLATGSAMLSAGDYEAPGIPNPLGIEVSSGELGFFGALDLLQTGWLVLGAVAAASLVVRFRRSRGEERQQLKWFAYAMVFGVFSLTATQLFLQDLVPVVVDHILLLVSLESPWIAIAVAILRYRLYDIDVIINRTLVYGTVTAVLATVYFGAVIVLEYALRAATGQESQIAIVASTLAIAALFNPLRRRVQAFVDRRFYRGKYDAQQTLEAFSARLRDEIDLDALGDDLAAVVRKTMRPAHVSVWLREPGKGER